MLFSKEHKNRTAFHLDGEGISFARLRESVEAEKKTLEQVARGILILRAEANLDFLCQFLAAFEMGRPSAIFSPDWTVADEEQRKNLLGHWVDRGIESASTRDLHDPNLLVTLFTSGSTGTPKAVQLSRANVLANTDAVIESLEFHRAAEQTLFLPLSYSYGLLGHVLPALKVGLTTRLLSKFTDTKLLFDSGEARGMWSGVPSHWETFLRIAPPDSGKNLSHVISAGAPFSLDLRKRLRDFFPNATIYNNYGLTECSPRVLSFSSRHPRFFEENTVGFPVKGLKASVNEEGELCVEGTQVMLGYLGDIEATNAKIQNGILRSGDGAKIDSDGLVSIFGRKDELFNIGGERMSPLEIDTALKRLPGIQDAAVLVEDHQLYGKRLVAFLVAATDEAKKQPKKHWIELLRSQLSGHKIPLEYHFVDALPRTSNGKLKRSELKTLKTGASLLR